MTTNRKSKIKKFVNRIDYGLILALLLPLFAIMPLLTHAGLPNTADGPVHLMRQVELNEAWKQGNFYPRWGTDLALGHGMPIFSYAPPLLYQLTQLFHLSGLPLDGSMKAVLVADFLLYSLGMFLFTRRIFGSGPALLAAAVYVYAPYRLREAYIQGNYGQFSGLAFYPLIFWAFHGLILDGRPRYLIAAALSLAGLLLSHNISAMLFLPIFAAYLVFLLVLTIIHQQSQSTDHPPQSINDQRPPALGPKGVGATGDRQPVTNPQFPIHIPHSAIRIIIGGLLGLGLAAIFWLPAFGERHEIKLEGIVQGFFDFRENFISVTEFFSPPLPLDLTAINPEFPLSLGLPQIIGAGLGILGLLLVMIKCVRLAKANTARSERSSFSRLFPVLVEPFADSKILHSLFFTGFLLLYGFLATPPSQPIWEAVPLLELTEFPWRMLGPAIFCASFLSATALAFLTNKKTNTHSPAPPSPIPKPHSAFRNPQSIILLSIAVTIALNGYYLYPSQFIVWGTPTPADAFAYEVVSGAIGTTSTGEFLPRGAQQHPQPDTLWPDYEAGRPPQLIDPATLPAGATAATVSHLAEADTVRIDTPQPFEATIRSLYWPGWQLYLDDQPVEFTITAQTGLIQTTIPAGQHVLSLRLESTPLRTIGQWLTISSLIILILLTAITLKSETSLLSRWLTPQGHRAAAPFARTDSLVTPRFFVIAAGLLMAFYFISRPLAPLFILQSDPNRPEPADQILQVDFDDQIRLVGMDNLPQAIQQPARGTADLNATVYWRALQDLDTNYAVFLHLDAPNGQTLATVDEAHPENIPTRNWPPGLYLRNSLHLELPSDIPPIRYDVMVGVYQRDADNRRLTIVPGEATAFKLGSIWLTGPQSRLPGQPLARFGSDISLLHAQAPTPEDETLILYWQTAQPVGHNYTIFIHLLDHSGNLLAQADGVPYDGLYPLGDWQPEKIIIDRRSLANLAQVKTIAIGLYDPQTEQRLPAVNAQGEPLPDDRFMLVVTP